MSDQSGEPIGSVLGNYRIERLLGRGGFAAVYVAEDVRPQLKRKVALKVLNPALTADATFRERFLRESLMAVGLDEHPSIVPVHDAGEDDGKLYIAMRFIDGIDLKQAIDAQGHLEPGYVASITSQVAGALDVAHAAGLVHRDVKPANVLLSKNGQRAYLADFGLTKRLDADQALTQVPGYMGTTFYSPPEQFEGTAIGPTADVYALGAVIFHCLTGEPPFPGTPESVIGAHLTKPVPLATSKRPDLPPAVNDVITRAMAKDPRDRQQSAGLLAAELSRAVVPADRTTGGTVPPPPFPPPAEATAYRQVPSSPGAYSSGPNPPPPGSASTGPPSGPGPFVPPPPTSNPPGYVSGRGFSSEPPGGAGPPPTWSSDPDRSSSPGKGRKRLVVGSVLVVALVLVAAIVAVLLSRGGGKAAPPTTDAPPVTTAAFPDNAEKSLLNTVPRDRRDQCKRSTAAFGKADATVRCSFSSEQADELTLVAFGDKSELDKQFKSVLSDNSSKLDPNTDCRWADNATHSYSSHDGSGNVACYFARGNSYVVWSNTSSKHLAIASKKGTESIPLYNWWADLVHRTDRALGLRDPSPGEQTLLKAIPTEFSDTCRRNEDNNSDATGITASVRCTPAENNSPDAANIESVVFYSFRDTETMNADYLELLGKAGAPAGNDCPGEIGYDAGSETSAGRRFCALGNGKAQVVWSRNAVNTVAVATATDADYKKLVDVWWTKDAYYNT